MSTATSGVVSSNDSHSSMSPALINDSSQDVVIQENGSTGNHGSPTERSSTAKKRVAYERSTNHNNDEVIFVDLQTVTSKGDQTFSANGANGTRKHICHVNVNSNNHKANNNVKIADSMTCGQDNGPAEICSVAADIKSVPTHSPPDLTSVSNDPHSEFDISHECGMAMTDEHSRVEITEVDSNENRLELTDVVSRQELLEVLANKLSNRIHYLQSTVVTRHVRQQLMVLVEYHHKVLNEMSKPANPPSTSTIYPASLIDLNSLNNLSTSALVDLVQRIQTHFSPGKSNKQPKCKPSATVTLSQSEKSGVQLAAGVMSRNLQELHADMDSDATESSSGGESDDEDVEHSTTSQLVAEESRPNNL